MDAMKAKEFVQKLLDSVTKLPLKELKKFLTSLPDQSAIDSTIEGRGRTAIHFAAARGDIPVFDLLFSMSKDQFKCDNDGNSAIFIAVQHDLIDMVKHLVSKGYNPKQTRNGNVGLLHIAASNGSLKLLEYLLTLDLPIDLQSEDLGSPLQWAVAFAHPQVIHYLHTKGAKIIIENNDARFPPALHLAINSQNQQVIDMLIKLEPKTIEIKDSEGWNTLQTAAEIGNLNLVKTLSEKLDVNYKCNGRTALDLAFQNDKWECVNFLKGITVHTELKKEVIEEEKPIQISKEDQDIATEFKDKGNKLFQAQQFEQAIEEYTNGIKHNPQNEIIFSNRAACYLNLKMYQEALQDSQISKGLNNKWAKAHFREGEAYFHMNNYCEAAGSYWEAFKLEPNNLSFKSYFDKAVKLGKQQFKNDK